MAIWRALRSGHWPSLLAAWVHFEVSFMVWLLIGALGVFISEELHLTATQKGLLVAVPLLGGALLRIPVGLASDRFGPKSTGLFVLMCELIALVWGWGSATTYVEILFVGLFLGIAGASFAVALPLASRVYPPAHQGLAMGLAASANSGTVLAALFAPRLGQIVGWHGVFGLMTLPLLLSIAVFAGLARGDGARVDRGAGFADMAGTMLRRRSMYWLSFLYAVTFGGFVGLCSFLPIFFHDEYGVSLVDAGALTAACGLAGSFMRPVGGYAGDRLGGRKVLLAVFPAIAGFIVAAGHESAVEWAAVFMVAAVAAMGFGNGVVFQIVADQFQKQMGMASGFIGAAGGLGGFLFPFWLGLLKDATGSYHAGFLLFAAVCAAAGVTVWIALRRARHAVNALTDADSLGH